MTLRNIAGILAVGAAALVAKPVLTAQQGGDGPAGATADGAFIQQYCVSCHSERVKSGGLVLERIDLAEHTAAAAALREKVIRKVRSGIMPPSSARRPDKADVTAFVTRLAAINDREAQLIPNPGRPVVHRLNRAEYTNAIRDLLEIDIDGRAMLPPDDSSYGFDNVADVLSISPSLLDRYLVVARKISRIAVSDATMRPETQSYKLTSSLLQEDRMSEDLPFGTRGGLSVRHHFPVDAEYELRVRLQRTSINVGAFIRGLDDDAIIHVLLDGVKVREVVVDGSALPKDGMGIERYREREYAAAVESSLRVRLPVKAGPHRIAVTFARRYWYAEGVGVSRLPLASDAYNNPTTTTQEAGKVDLEIANVEVFGPFGGVGSEPTHRGGVLSCPSSAGKGNDEACARTILARIARQAYRRPVNAEDLSVLMPFYKAARAERGFEYGVQKALERILVSPYFLFRKEEDPAGVASGATVRVSDIDLASRLSFFLWSSIPDDELLEVAIGGRLRDPDILAQQVVRMMRHERSRAFLTNFFGQWLYLRNLGSHVPDPKLFAKFDDSLRDAFRQETERFLESQVREDRSVLELFTANYSFMNERLARYYGIPNVFGNHFRRVTLPGDSPRAGLLGQGSLLTVTSYADRTSPVLRGKWLLENVLGVPPPPPPPDVPPFPENRGGDAPKTVRARMELHRRNPVCATCHSRIDPLGFALENFDAAGQYRTTDNGNAVDASGMLPDGTRFNGPAEFRDALLNLREEVLTTATEKLLTYALGRGVEHYDQPAIRQIVREAAGANHKWSALITSLVKSVPFQMRRSES